MHSKFKITIFALMIILLITNSYAGSRKKLQQQSKIVGGFKCEQGQCPWVAALVTSNTFPYDVFCGGSLIHPKWVLTAGHCVEDENTTSFEVVTGMYNINSDNGQKIKIKRIIQHPDYNGYTLENDIALIELQEESSAKPISVYRGNNSFEGTYSTVMGWGNLKEYGYAPDDLMKVSIQIVSNQACSQAYWPEDEILETMICAGSDGKDSCQGDSGGPLVVYYMDEWILVGIVSWGEGCADPGYYGVYTRVSKFSNFIDNYVPSEFTQIKLFKGWNLISLPFNPVNSEINVIFPEAEQAFKYYNNVYISVNRIVAGNGYWIYVPSTKSYTIYGYSATDIPFDSTKGWHLIGTVNGNCFPVNFTQLNASIFEYVGGTYIEVDKCNAKKGYWVKF